MAKKIGSEVETSLRTALSYIEEVEKQIDKFRGSVQSASQRIKVAKDSGQTGMGARMKSTFPIVKEQKRLLDDLDLAEKELRAAEQKDPDAEIEFNKGSLTIPMIKSLIYRIRGIIHISADEFISGELKKAERYFRDSLKYFETSDTYYLLAKTLEDMKEPRKACEVYQKCINTDESDGECVITARKDLQRLESKKLGSGWFVGSWKVFLAFSGFTIFLLIGTISEGAAEGIIPTLIMGGITGIYWWRKWR